MATTANNDGMANQETVDAALTDLASATLTFTNSVISGGDKAALTAAIENATTLLGSISIGTAVGNVSQSAHDTYNNEITSATTVKSNPTASQATVDAAVATLASATQSFTNSVIPGVDKTALTAAIENATTLLDSKSIGTAVGNVSQSTHDTYNSAIAAATTVENDITATQETVDAAVVALNGVTTNFYLAIIAKPIITLNGPSNVTIQIGSIYHDAGAIANDYKGGDITSSIVVINTVDTTTAGTYIIRFHVMDSNGNAADEVIRTVQVMVNQDVKIPNENRIAGGYGYSLALKSDGTVVGWGNNVWSLSNIPAGLNEVVKIAANNDHALALISDGSVVAWGGNGFGETNVPNGLTGVIKIATGGHHNLVIKSDGTVTAWGWNASGQTNVPTGLTGVVSIAAGYDFSLALKADGTVVAWGNNIFGQTSVPTSLTDVIAVAAGEAHSLALKSDGTIVAWGDNDSGGETEVPAGLSGVKAIATGGYHSLALKSDGTVVAWGLNTNGQSNVPAGLNGVVAVAAGHNFSLALKSDGTVAAWGENTHGQTNVPSDLNLLPLYVADITKPIITINGTSDITLQIGSTYTDEGATAHDNIDGNITSKITTSGTVDTTISGTYILHFNVKDSSGNTAEEVIRTVHVVAANTQLTAKLVVQIGVNPDDSDSLGIFIGLDVIKDSTGNVIYNSNVAGYQIELDYDPAKVDILDVVDVAHIGHLTKNVDTVGKVTVTDSSTIGTADFQKLFFLPINLTGSAVDVTSLSVKVLSLRDAYHNQISVEDHLDLVFHRGKIFNEGPEKEPNINDAVAGLQYLAGLKNDGSDLGQVNPINMASIVGQGSGTSVIKPSIKDVIALMQYLVQLRDSNFELVSNSN